jgi:uncharacterized protein (TIGR01777 family)
MDKILLTGGSGLVGRRLTDYLQKGGWEVAVLTRQPGHISATTGPTHSAATAGSPAIRTFLWDPGKGTLDPAALDYARHIIHLAGANLGEKRWTRSRKEVILLSRTRTAETLKLHLDRAGVQPDTFITASATGYYGNTNRDKVFTEGDPPGEDFAARVCRDWEAAADRFASPQTRVLKIRMGVVLSGQGGALPRLARLSRLGLCSPLGTGRQYFPWIHLEDLCGIFLHVLLAKDMHGAFNAVAPEMVTNREFTRTLCRQMDRNYLLPPVPSPLLHLVLGEMSSILTRGNRCSPAKLMEAGFTFRHPQLLPALETILKNSS